MLSDPPPPIGQAMSWSHSLRTEISFRGVRHPTPPHSSMGGDEAFPRAFAPRCNGWTLPPPPAPQNPHTLATANLEHPTLRPLAAPKQECRSRNALSSKSRARHFKAAASPLCEHCEHRCDSQDDLRHRFEDWLQEKSFGWRNSGLPHCVLKHFKTPVICLFSLRCFLGQMVVQQYSH